MSALLEKAKSMRGVKTNAGRRRLKHLDKQGSRPSDELTTRFLQWNTITKSLIAYYETTKKLEEEAAKEAGHKADKIPVPFAEGGQFDQEAGFQHAFYGVRDATRRIGQTHTELAGKIDTAVLLPLTSLSKEIGDHSAQIDADLGATINALTASRKESIKAIGEHSKGVGLSASVNGHSAASSKNDPFITHGIAHRQLTKQVELENKATTSTIHWQKASEAFEARLVTHLQDITKAYTAAQVHAYDRLKAEQQAIEKLLTGVESTAEWAYFANPEVGRIVDPNTTLRDAALISFPNQQDESVTPVKTGHLERKKRFTKNYIEYFFVLTPSGFLHAYPHEGVDGTTEPEAMLPRLSLYLPEFTLGPASGETEKKHKFHVTAARGNAVGKDSSRGLSMLGLKKNKEVAYTFKARSHGELMAWWTAIDQVVKSSVTVTANPGFNKNASKAETAVANLGLPVEEHEEDDETVAASEDATPDAIPGQPRTVAPADISVSPVVAAPAEHKESDEESLGGSSVEEEGAAAKDVAASNAAESAEVGAGAATAEALPSYVQGSSAYPIEKKVAFGDSPAAAGDAPSTSK